MHANRIFTLQRTNGGATMNNIVIVVNIETKIAL